MRVLIVGYCAGIRLERRLREEVHLNLADGWSADGGHAVREYLASLDDAAFGAYDLS